MWVFLVVVDGWFRAAALCCCLHSVSTWSGVRWSIAEWRRLRSHRDPVRAVTSRIAWSRVERTPRFTSSSLETALNDSATALPQQPPARPTDGRTPRPAMNPVHPAHAHRAPDPSGGPRHHGSADRPGTATAEAPATSPTRMRPAIARPTTPPRETIHDDRRVGGSPPGRTMRDAAHPSHPGRGGGDAPASRPARPARRRHDPSRPVPEEADGQPDPPPPRSRGPRRARGLDAAPGRPRVDPAATGGPVRTRRRTRRR